LGLRGQVREEDEMSVWFITGASRGFGIEIVREALSHGHQVVATARDSSRIHDRFPDAGDRLLPVDLDIVDEARAHAAVSRAVERFGRIDVVVNNAGRGLLSAVEEASDAGSLYTETAQIADYADSSGAMRRTAAMVNHAQPGDPVKAAAAIVAIAESPLPPLRLQLGTDSVDRVEEKLATVRRELDIWRAVSVSTDHPDVGADVTRG
jgi:NAD(P)-dependent dehydrogenase (short-subunit alcohol dehydrogenase family)